MKKTFEQGILEAVQKMNVLKKALEQDILDKAQTFQKYLIEVFRQNVLKDIFDLSEQRFKH
ncbi:17089_t:CDS:1, partial [Racocetra fulgida]